MPDPTLGWESAAREYREHSAVQCSRCRSLLEEIRQLNELLDLRTAERDEARRVCESLAGRCVGQSEALTARAEEE